MAASSGTIGHGLWQNKFLGCLSHQYWVISGSPGHFKGRTWRPCDHLAAALLSYKNLPFPLGQYYNCWSPANWFVIRKKPGHQQTWYLLNCSKYLICTASMFYSGQYVDMVTKRVCDIFTFPVQSESLRGWGNHGGMGTLLGLLSQCHLREWTARFTFFFCTWIINYRDLNTVGYIGLWNVLWQASGNDPSVHKTWSELDNCHCFVGHFFLNFYNSPVDKPKLGPKCPHSMILASVRAHYLSGCHLLHLHKLVVWSKKALQMTFKYTTGKKIFFILPSGHTPSTQNVLKTFSGRPKVNSEDVHKT